MNLKLFFDEKFFLGSGRRKIAFLAGLVLLTGVLVFAWDEWGAPALLGKTIGTGRSLRETLLGMLGALEFSGTVEGADFGRAVLMRLFSVVVFGGILVSTLCSMMQQREDRVQNGLVRYRGFGRHYIVVGWSPVAASLIERLLRGDMDSWHPGGAGMRSWAERHLPWRRPRLLLFTEADVADVRRNLEGQLPASLYHRIVFYRGSVDIDTTGAWFDRLFSDMGAAVARQIYLLSDIADPWGRDAKLLAFAQALCDRLQTRTTARRRFLRGLPQVVPVFAELDARGSQDYAKRLDFITMDTRMPKLPRSIRGVLLGVHRALGHSTRDFAAKTAWHVCHALGFVSKTLPYFRPFSFHELWARRLFAVDAAPEYRLDYRPMGRDDYVHLVIVGFNRMGSALALEAIRSCHYVQWNPTGTVPTRITIIDLNPQEDVFRARYPHLDQIQDVDVTFVKADVASRDVRNLLRTEAVEPKCLLTVAVCLEDSDAALSIALGLPEEVYLRREVGAVRLVRRNGKEEKIPLKHREIWKEGGNRVLVRQNLVAGATRAIRAAAKGPYACVQPFGMIPDVLTSCSFEERSAMYHHALWDNDGSSQVDAFLATCRNRNVLKRRIPAMFERFVTLPRELVWANVYIEDSYGAILRLLGLQAVLDPNSACGIPVRDNSLEQRIDNNLKRFPVDAGLLNGLLDTLTITPNGLKSLEHRRWVAERVLMGYRSPGANEGRDDDFRIHPQIKPFVQLDRGNITKDDNNIRAIPIILALEGFSIEKASTPPTGAKR